ELIEEHGDSWIQSQARKELLATLMAAEWGVFKKNRRQSLSIGRAERSLARTNEIRPMPEKGQAAEKGLAIIIRGKAKIAIQKFSSEVRVFCSASIDDL